MTKNDYAAIAKAINAARIPGTMGASESAIHNGGIDRAMNKVADMLAQDNPGFDRAGFIAACCGVAS